MSSVTPSDLISPLPQNQHLLPVAEGDRPTSSQETAKRLMMKADKKSETHSQIDSQGRQALRMHGQMDSQVSSRTGKSGESGLDLIGRDMKSPNFF